jgi:hypothetical protein
MSLEPDRLVKVLGNPRRLKWILFFIIAFFVVLFSFYLVTTDNINDEGQFENNNQLKISIGQQSNGLEAIEYAMRSSRADGNCIGAGCHNGIEQINAKMSAVSCPDCHDGNEDATDKNEAHDGMYVNPADMRIVDKTCGRCHLEYTQNIKKSLHATSAGIISAARYTWGAQDRDSKYGNYEIEDTDGNVPIENGALTRLDQVPRFRDSDEPVDDYLRNQCLRCHVWTEGAKRDGDFRADGCAACHVLYADEGKYLGNDPTINKSEKDHPIRHEITTKIPAEQCVHCHNRGGRTGVSFIGTMESDGYGTPLTEDGEKQEKLHGKFYNHLTPDIHYERGMQCIDCHTIPDIMGDGNIYGKKEEAVEIECMDCHGTPTEYPWNDDGKVLTSGARKADGTIYGTAGGNEFSNIVKDGDKLILTSKYDGKEHEIPLLKNKKDTSTWKSEMAKTAMSSIPHLNRLECFTCHAKWTPQCYGCHPKLDERTDNFDWLDGENNASSWSESRSYLRWETPVLGINAEGKVSPFVPGCQVIFTHIDENGNTVELNKIYTTVDGTSGISQNPIQPHTISGTARTCEDCHTNTKTLGLGTGIYDSAANGLDIDFELERIVDEEGNQIQATSHYGARPFNKEEQEKISRVGTCLGCHKSYSDPLWDEVTDVTGFVDTPSEHTSVMNVALTGIPGLEPMTVFLATDGHDSKIYLEWNFSHSEDVKNFELFWSTAEITDVSNLTANATTVKNTYVIENLTPETTYYFAIIAVDDSGEKMGLAFSNAKPTEVKTGDPEDDDDNNESGFDINIIYITIIVILMIIIIISYTSRKPSSPTSDETEEELISENNHEQKRKELPKKKKGKSGTGKKKTSHRKNSI